jgi:hypothetical protein
MYKVIKCFTDLTDGHKYDIGDIFPREGVEVSDARIAKLASSANRQKTPVIKEVEHSTETSEISGEQETALQSETVEEAPEPKAKRVYNRKKK